ncbi:3-hydroxypropanoate dehydrogenase [Endobacter medicaginis]|uniref:3-hydroxypropanoate dehydrogenase n=1 Tax=Endobacter medicaginis TaxID=1181271 RepID=A0A850NND8_9PROT|nr:malonic semialdehyde reductase [Endobacter medicaginis]MBB3174571.1 3-hydroxypropanoate dehydrogenase [Endobacter medicaginis]MCX5474737.1 malonic semialdehyde reductase [Endobacter medicaginis]NVN31281.1 malonic semialdehyde reductase [Endobacter medicaginis]
MSGAVADEVADITADAEAMLARLFDDAHTPRAWSDRPVPEALLRRLYDAVRLGPTSANCAPARLMFLTTQDARARLLGALSPGNVERVRTAPVTVIVAWDPMFYEHLPKLYPQGDARGWFAADPVLAEETAQRNAALQGAYLILAARALGLDVLPMSGFDNHLVDAQLLAGEGWRSHFLVSLGHASGPPPERAPRLDWSEACRLL